jgi:hypothetical protein
MADLGRPKSTARTGGEFVQGSMFETTGTTLMNLKE